MNTPVRVLILWAFLAAITLGTWYGLSQAASTNTVTVKDVPGQSMKVVTVQWHDNDTLAASTPQNITLNGFIHQVITRPHVDSTIQPQATQDYYLYYGHDNDTTYSILGTTLDNRSAENIEVVFPAPTAMPFVRDAQLRHVNSTVLDASGAIDFYVLPIK